MLRLLFTLSLFAPVLAAKEFEITAIAAKVNGHAITKNEVESLLAPRRELLQTMFPRQGEMYQTRLKQYQDCLLYTSPSPRDRG